MKKLILVISFLLFSSTVHATPILYGSGIINNAWSLMTVDQLAGTASQVGTLGGSGITQQVDWRTTPLKMCSMRQVSSTMHGHL